MPSFPLLLVLSTALLGGRGADIDAATADEVLEVLVLDAKGEPCPGTTLHLVSYTTFFDEPGEVLRTSHMDQYVAKVISGPEGLARFEGAKELLQPHEHMQHAIRLEIPPLRVHEVVVELADLGSGPVVVRKPACGALHFRVDASAVGVVWLRGPAESPDDPFWSDRHPVRATIASGRAVFPEVPPGMDFDYQLILEGVPTPLCGRVRGPAEPGLTATVGVPGLEAHPVLVGRVLDEDLQPIAGQELAFSVSRRTRGSSSSRGATIETDESGRFRFPLVVSKPKNGHRRGSIRPDYWNAEAVAALGDIEAKIDLDADYPRGESDLGDIVLHSPGATRLLGRLEDDALLRRYQEAQDFRGQRHVQACLLEMARRGTARWQSFLADEYRRVANAGSFGFGWDLEYLTVLRRAEGKRDPMALTIDELTHLAMTFPRTPVLDCPLVNQDEDGESFVITDGGSYRSGRFERIRVDVRDADGNRVPPLPRPGGMGGGMATGRTLAPGDRHPMTVHLGQYVQFPGPGKYRVVIQYHDQDDISDDATGEGLIVSTSAPFNVVLGALAIRVPRRLAEDVERWVSEIDVGHKVPLTGEPWKEGLAFTGEATRPEDHVFRTGLTAVPILIELLQSGELSAARAGWVLGLLHDLTGLHRPSYEAGDVQWLNRWPTIAGEATSLEALEPQERAPWEDHQAVLIERWKPVASWFEIEWTDED